MTLTPPIKWHGGKQVVLLDGCVSIVDSDDFDRVAAYRWFVDSNGYVRRTARGGKFVYMHREIMPGTLIDHINGDKLDNRKANLRPATKAQNAHNAKANRDKKTPARKGVCFDKLRGKWSADIMANGVRKRLGRFATESEAAEAYRVAAITLHGEFVNAD